MLNYGDVVRNTISDDAPIMEFTFTARAGDLVTVMMTKTQGDLDALLYILDPNNDERVRNDDYNPGVSVDAGIEEFTIPESGTYTIIATRFQETAGMSTGEFELSLMIVSSGDSNRMAYGDVVRDEITLETSSVTYTFEGQRGDAVSVLMERLDGDLDAQLVMLSPIGEELVRNDDYDPGVSVDAGIIDFILPESGLYTIIATRFQEVNGTSTGDYALSLTLTSTDGGSNFVTYGDIIESEITNDAPEVAFLFEARRGDVVGVLMTRRDGDLDSLLVILDPSGEELFSNDDIEPGASLDAGMIDLLIPEDGVYTIVATRFQGEVGVSIGTFTLTLMLIEQGTVPVVVAAVPPVGNQLSYGDVIIDAITNDTFAIEYVFEAQAGDVVTIMMNRAGTDTDLDALFYILGPTGEFIVENDDFDAGVSVDAGIEGLRLPDTGLYTIVATRFQQDAGMSTGEFTLSLMRGEPGEPPTRGTAPVPEGIFMGYDEIIVGEITDDQPAVHYLFEAQAGDVINIQMRSLGELDPFIALLAPNGAEIASNDDDPEGTSFDSFLHEFVIANDGVYTIIATRYNRDQGDSTGGYELELHLAGDADTLFYNGGNLFLNNPITGAITIDDFARYYTFDGEQGQTITVAMDAGGGDLDPYLILVGPDGRQIVRNDDNGENINAILQNIRLPETGQYTVVATRFRRLFGTTSGSFWLEMAETAGPSTLAAFTRPIQVDVPETDRLDGYQDSKFYNFWGQAGDVLTIRMFGAEGLDVYLILEDALGREIARNNDDLVAEGNRDDATLQGVILPEDGHYIIIATTWSEEVNQGDYELILSRRDIGVPNRRLAAYGVIHPWASGGIRPNGEHLMYYVVGDVSPNIGRDYLSYSLLTFVLPDFPPGTPVQEARLNLDVCRVFGDDPFALHGRVAVFANNHFLSAQELVEEVHPNAPVLAELSECGIADVTDFVAGAVNEGARYVQFRLAFDDATLLDNDVSDSVVFIAPRLEVVPR
jgi:hypothetical protein